MASFEHALGLLRRGDRAGALSAVREVLSEAPDRIDALNLAAELERAAGDAESAVAHLRRAASLTPWDAAALRRLGQLEFSTGAMDAAVATFRRALELDPDDARARHNLGAVMLALGDDEGAREAFLAVLARDPAHATAHANLGLLEARAGMHARALERYQRATALEGESAAAHLGLASALLALGRPGEALAASDRVSALAPRSASGWLVRARILSALSRNDAAIEAARQSVTLAADDAEAHRVVGQLAMTLGRNAEALAAFEQSCVLEPTAHAARLGALVAHLPRVAATEEEVTAGRARFERALAILGPAIAAAPAVDASQWVGAYYPFYLAYQEEDQRALMSAHGDLCANAMAGWLDGPPSLVRRVDRRGTKLKVAIVSAYVADHSVHAALSRGWIEGLDRRQFELAIFHVSDRRDRDTEAAEAAADLYVGGTRPLSDWVAAIRAWSPHVLLYPEVGMDPSIVRLASLRLAPAQAVGWGHPMTTGLPTMDFYLSAQAFEPEDAQAHYRERLELLANFGSDYRPVVAAPGSPPASRDGSFTIVCAGTPFKYAPRHDDLLVSIARRIPHATFRFYSYRDGVLTTRLLERLHAAFARAGLDGARFLSVVPWAAPTQFHEALRAADVMLDTVGFFGFNTVAQALECGLPVASVRGRFLRGRLGSGLLDALGLDELVADDKEALADRLADQVASDPRLEGPRASIALRRTALFADPAPVRSLEAFLGRVA